MSGDGRPEGWPATLFAPVAGCRTIGLAVSGGADSLALMLLAADWAATRAPSPRLVVYSVDHGLRPEAAGEVAFVLREAGRLGLEARGLAWAGPKPATGVQAAARRARYRLIGEAMRADGAEVLLTAHHRDDQTETVLMRLAHGSGLGGLRGMASLATVEGVPVCRPLLGVAPEVLGARVEAAGLAPVIDPGNRDPHYERVRWRETLPRLAAMGLDGVTVARFARRAGEADAALEAWAGEAFARLVAVDGFGAARLAEAELDGLPRAVGVKLVGRVLAAVGGARRPHALGAVERLRDRLATAAPGDALTGQGVAIRRRGGWLWFSREPGRHPIGEAVVAPAGTLAWDGRFRIVNGLDVPVQVRMAELSRAAAERLIGRRLTVPAAAIRSAPLVTGPAGDILALACHRLHDGISVELVVPQSIFGRMTPN